MRSGPVLWHQMSVKNTGHKYIVRQNIWCWHSHCTVHFDRQQTLSYIPTPGEYPPHATCIPNIPSQFTSTTQHRHYFTEFYEQLATSTLSHRSDTARTIETSLLLQLYCVFKNGRPITQEPNFAETNLGNIIFKMFTFKRKRRVYAQCCQVARTHSLIQVWSVMTTETQKGNLTTSHSWSFSPLGATENNFPWSNSTVLTF